MQNKLITIGLGPLFCCLVLAGCDQKLFRAAGGGAVQCSLRGEFKPIARRVDFKPKDALLVPRIAELPVIDGRADEVAWKNAAVIPSLVVDSSPERSTEVRLAADTQCLYVAFQCAEPEMNKIRTDVKPADKKTSAVWNDDAVEVLVDPTGDRKTWCYFVMNATGAVFCAEYGGQGARWDAEFKSAVTRDKSSWTAEFALPFRLFSLDGSRSDLPLRMQFARLVPGKSEHSWWVPGGDDSQSFGTVVIDRRPNSPVITECTLGNFFLGVNKFGVGVKNFPEGKYEARLMLNGQPIPPLAFEGGTQSVSLAYNLEVQNLPVKTELTVVRKDVNPEQIIETAKGEFMVPQALVACFRNAHIREDGATRMWVRAFLGDAEPVKLQAVIVDEKNSPLAVLDLPAVPGGAGEGWFDFNAKGLIPGPYKMRVECAKPKVAAEAKFWVERVNVPELATVPLMVDEPAKRDWKSFPVSVGVPFPRAILDSVDRVRIIDRSGKEIPAQVKLTSSWNEDGRDVRWLLASFLADSEKDRGNQYALEFGKAVKRAVVPNPILVEETEGTVAIDTGRIRLVIDRKQGTIIREISLDGKPVIAGESGGVYLQNQDRKIFRSAWEKEAPEITIEERGPIEAVVHQTGWYSAKDGERLCRYDIRIHAFAGQPYLKILHTWILTHDSRKVRFGDISFRFPLAEKAAKCAFGVDENFNKPAWEAPLAANGRISLVQDDSDKFRIIGWRRETNEVMQTGRRSGGWAGVWTDKSSVMAHLRYLWGHYPAELEITPDALAVHFWPEHDFSFQFHERPESYGVHRWPYTDGAFMDLQPREYVEKTLMKDVEKIAGYDKLNALGLSMTQEIWLDLGSTVRTASDLQECARKYEQPLAAKADAQWIGDTRVFRPFLAKDENDFPLVERAISARWQAETYLQDRCHDYGWLHYGDRHSQSLPYGPNAKFTDVHRYWLVSDYRCGMEPWLLWARSGERIYFRWAEIASRHIMDVDTIHWGSDAVEPVRKKGYFYPMSYGHYCSRADSMTLHNEPVGYNMMYYYLTGYRRSLDIVRICGEVELENDLSRSTMHRGHAVTGHNQLDLYRITWDERHWESAFKAINKGLDAAIDKSYLSPTYSWEWCHDIEDFTGDSRLKEAVLNMADNLVGKPLGICPSTPFLYTLGHAYELTDDPKYIAWGKGKLEFDICNINLSDNPELRGRCTKYDNERYTRVFRTVPGYLYWQKKAEEKHGPIMRRTQPIQFIYERGPVYFLKDKNREFSVKVYLEFNNSKTNGYLRLTAPDGTIADEKPVKTADFHGSGMEYLLNAPPGGRTGTYRLDIDIQTEGDDVQGIWGIVENADIRNIQKTAYQITKFTIMGGHVFMYVPKGTEMFRIKVVPREFGVPYGQPVLLGPDGVERMRLPHSNKDWIEVRPKPEDTGGLWGLVIAHIGDIEIEGLPEFVYSDPSEYFLPEGPAVIKSGRKK